MCLSERFESFWKTRVGGLWIASDEGLLFFKDDDFRIWTETDGLSSNHIVTLYKDKEGVLWIGTADGGLNRFRRAGFNISTCRTAYMRTTFTAFLEDRAGFLWLTCRKGISRVKKEELNAFSRAGLLVSFRYTLVKPTVSQCGLSGQWLTQKFSRLKTAP